MAMDSNLLAQILHSEVESWWCWCCCWLLLCLNFWPLRSMEQLIVSNLETNEWTHWRWDEIEMRWDEMCWDGRCVWCCKRPVRCCFDFFIFFQPESNDSWQTSQAQWRQTIGISIPIITTQRNIMKKKIPTNQNKHHWAMSSWTTQ